MSFLRSKFNSVYCKTRSLSPQCIEFCEQEIHDPLYDCCFGLELTSTRHVQCFSDCHKNKCNEGIKKILSKRIFANKKESPGAAFKPKSFTKKFKNRKLKSAKSKVMSSSSSSLPCVSNVVKMDYQTLEKKTTPKRSPKITVTTASTPVMSPTIQPLSIKYKSTSNLARSLLDLEKPLVKNQLSKSTNRLATSYLHRNYEWKTIFQNLCEQFNSLRCHTPRVTRIQPQISEHDKKILKCMALKRIEEITQLEDAMTARADWEREKFVRKIILEEQNAEFGSILREKRKLENVLRDQRINDLLEQQRSYVEKIRNEIEEKDHRLSHRIKNIKYNRDLMQCQRRQDEMKKAELANLTQEENRVEDEIRRRECQEQLDNRITRADIMRNYMLNSYRRRINEENQKHQIIHGINYEEVKKVEKLNLEMLRQRLNERDNKCKQFLNDKQKWVEGCRDQARITSELRDILRRSISPDNYSYRNNLHSRNERQQISNFTIYETHLK